MWIFENGSGRRVTATLEDGPAMVADGSSHSCLWPRGSADEEAAELKRLIAADQSLIPGFGEPAKKEEVVVEEASQEVHVRRRNTPREE